MAITKESDKACDILSDALKKYPKKRIELETLKSFCPKPCDYRDSILELVDQGLLTPIKSSKTDGNLQRPLYLRYNINACVKKPQVSDDEIRTLHPRLIANGYLLCNRERYLADRIFLQKLSDAMSAGQNGVLMSRRERSFFIFGDEKALDKHIRLLEKIGVSGETLGYYSTPEQCFSDYIPVRKPEMTLLICENKDIWFNIRRLMYESMAKELFGIRLDGVIFGQGNDITGEGKLSSYAHFLGTKTLEFLYCGDIDRAGFDIFLRLCDEAEELNIRLFVPAYKKMLELSENIILPDSDDKRGKIPDISELSKLFYISEQERIFNILKENKRLPQEILSYPVLAENMR